MWPSYEYFSLVSSIMHVATWYTVDLWQLYIEREREREREGIIGRH
jgi:hypothetical protein